MASKNNWFTVPAVNEQGQTIIVTGRLDVDAYRAKPKNCIRVEVSMKYKSAGELGFPDDDTAELLQQATDAMQAELKGKTTALMTGIFTGAGQRDWVFYTFSTDVFGSYLNRALAQLPVLPLEIYAENDPDWAEYDEMLSVAEDAAAE